jgi:Icc-related predicted phosphoesterase
MKITFISDTHTKHHEMTNDLPGGPIIVHCGDVSGRGNVYEINEFLEWFSDLPYTHKIFIAGNHDFGFEKPYTKSQIVIPENIHYLEDSSVLIEGIKFYGSPWQPWFFNWAFNLPRSGNELKEKWSAIPEDTDVLVVHAPPKGILDVVIRGSEHVGCELLRDRILEVKPKVVAFGHIHEAYGKEIIDEITYINASLLDLRYDYTNKPIIIDYE